MVMRSEKAQKKAKKMRYVLVAESGSDIPPELAKKYGICIVPMHVCFGTETKDDSRFPVEEVFSYYEETKELPKTSGCTPEDFRIVFDDIHSRHPDRHILHLAYSAVTTCSFQSARIAAMERDYVTSIDTQYVTVGQGMVVLAVADYLQKNPDCPLEEVLCAVERYRRMCRMCFFPGDMVYLKAGGRVSNAAYLGAKILSLSPRIGLKDGKLVATRKYRGSMERNAIRLLDDFTKEERLKRQMIAFVYSPGLDEKIRKVVTERAAEMGFEQAAWFQTGCVISVHGGPGAFGICGFSEKEAGN